jgi:hypothetical protein
VVEQVRIERRFGQKREKNLFCRAVSPGGEVLEREIAPGGGVLGGQAAIA